jgi:hypothetical protein
LLGDINANGLTDAGETTLFVPLAAAQQLITASDSATDTRQILMKEALAAQLNVNNMSGDSTASTTNPEGPTNLVAEAAMWLRGLGLYTYASSTGKVDANADGSLSVGTSTSFEYNTSTKAFTADANSAASGTQTLASNLGAWTTDVDVDSTWRNIQASGVDLKNGLHELNQGHLVVSQDGASVGWSGDGSNVVDVHANVTDASWGVLHDHAIL